MRSPSIHAIYISAKINGKSRVQNIDLSSLLNQELAQSIKKTSVQFENIVSIVDTDFRKVNEVILDQLHSKVPFVRTVGEYLINSGGKRLRPLVALLAAKSFNYEGEQHLHIATIIEFLHTATLLHDDVVDGSRLRRGKPSANALWGNASSVLVGDFLISRAFQMIVGLKNLRAMEILSNATNVIAEGEVLQLLNCKNPQATEEQYMRVIYCKTAKMFEASTQIGAVIAEASNEQEEAIMQYGKHLGIAFQIQDDILDYTGDAQILGKNVGDDFAEGKLTLPVIFAMQHTEKEDQIFLRTAILAGGTDNIDKVIMILNTSGAIDYCYNAAQQEVAQAKHHLSCLPQNKYTQCLADLADLSIARKN